MLGLTSLRTCTRSNNDVGGGGGGVATVDQLVSTFSSDPSLIAFAQLCSNHSWNSRQVKSVML